MEWVLLFSPAETRTSRTRYCGGALPKRFYDCPCAWTGTSGEQTHRSLVLHLISLCLRYQQAKKALLQAAEDDKAARLPSPPDAPPPALPLEQLASTFSHPSYGPITFLLTESRVLESETNWMGYPINSLMLQHYSGNTFNASLTISVPVLDQDELVDVVFDGLIAEFEVEQGVVRGFGLWGGVWGAGVGVEPLKGTSARELAEVWFDHDAGLMADTLSSDQKPLIRG